MALAIIMYFNFIKNRKIFFVISITLVALSISAVLFFGLNLGIDFTGGATFGVNYQTKVPDFSEVQQVLAPLGLGEITLQKSGERGLVLKSKSITENQYGEILGILGGLGDIEEGSENFQSIGPLIGNELKQKTNIVIVLAIIAILLYIAVSFRKMSRPIKSYVYSVAGVVALFHDLLIPLGIFAVLGKLYGVEINIPIITAFLTVFGYSINDTVVVLDRIRENLIKNKTGDFAEAINDSLNQTFARSVNTSLTVLIVLSCLFIFGGEALRYFALTLLLGVGVGTYSSIFLVSPLVFSYTLAKQKRALRIK